MIRSCLSRLGYSGRFVGCRVRQCVLTLLVVLGGGAVVFIAASEPVSAATDVEATEYCEIPADQPQINVVMLLDASGSLNTSDPDNSRRDGLEAAIKNLATLARNNPDVTISVAVDTFATGYQQRYGWLRANEAPQDLTGRYDSITKLGMGNARRLTDYRQAMSGVADRLRTAPPSDCNLLLWFTDGEHATEGTSSDVSAREWQQLRDLCESREMGSLVEKRLYTVGVLLSSVDRPVNSGPLRHLFGEPTEDGPVVDCEHALNGQISDNVNIDALSNVLDELINEVVYEVNAEAETDDDLPNEQPGLPDETEYQECDTGIGTEQSPCEFSFSLDSGHESFRIFVDMTFLVRKIENPQAVNFRVQSPSGERSDQIVAAAQIEEADANPYQPILPFWFLSRRPYDSRWEIIGHQAAEPLAREGDWEWNGEWSLLFWGDTDAATADARKVAAAVRTVTVDSASADGMTQNDAGTLIGFVENYPTADYSSVELNLEPRDSTGNPLYSTRLYLKCEAQDACDPVPMSSDDRRFEVPSLYEELRWWDSEEGGGNGRALQSALAERGPVSLFAVLAQEFHYGGSNGYGAEGERGTPLSWVRDIGSLNLDDLSERLDWSNWIDSGEPPALPSDIEMVSPPLDVSGDAVSFEVKVHRGYLPGIISLVGASKLVGSETSPVAGYDQDWSCEVADTREQPNDDPPTCDAIELNLGVSEDSEVIVTLDFLIDTATDLESSEFPEEFRNNIQQRVANERRSESVDSEPITIDIATASDTFGKFIPSLVALAALAALARLVVAWKLRPWSPLGNAEYVTKRLTLGEDGQGESNEEPEVDLCMALTARNTKGTLGEVTVKSSWGPLLLGRKPLLQATSTRGGCIGPSGSRHGKDGQIGIIGPDLSSGWVVTTDGQEHFLVVWDFDDEEDRSARIAEVEDAATEKVKSMRSRAHPLDREPKSAADDHAANRDQRPDRSTTASDPFDDSGDSDPFESSSDPSDLPEDPFAGPSDPFR